jgi:hypothetical protein
VKRVAENTAAAIRVAFCMINGALRPLPFLAYSRSTEQQNARSNLHRKCYFLAADAGVLRRRARSGRLSRA